MNPITLEWDGEHPAGIDDLVVADIKANLSDLSAPEDLCFHHVFLSGDIYGPSVFVYGVKGSPAFHCEYLDKTEWSK